MTEYKCPHCGEGIERVDYVQQVTEDGYCDINENEEYFDHEYRDTSHDGDTTYKCTDCGGHLGNSYDEVMDELEEITEEEDEEEEEISTNLKVGDKVIIRSDLENKHYPDMENLYVNNEMVKIGGEERTIKSIDNWIYLDDGGYAWHEKCFIVKTKEQSYKNDIFEVSIISNKLLIQEADNILEYPISKIDELKETLNKKEVLSLSDGADTIKLDGIHDKLLELLEQCNIL